MLSIIINMFHSRNLRYKNKYNDILSVVTSGHKLPTWNVYNLEQNL